MGNIISYTQIFQKSRNHLKTLGTIRMTLIKFHTQGPQILGTTVQNLVACMTWHLGFVQLSSKGFLSRMYNIKKYKLINTIATKYNYDHMGLDLKSEFRSSD